ncbi:MAG: uridylate kinase [Clostridiales bacterium]|nr:uridylate kinase [Clostridiales bacterium]
MNFEYDVVGKIGSMALIRKEDHDIDYNIFSRIGAELKPGMIWVTSGATEIGRLDYMKRTGKELSGDMDEIKTDYAAQGQSILMENYRRFIRPEYSVRQVLVEHQHFNDADKRAHIKGLLLRAKDQNAIPIVNYNDPVSFTENRKMEIASIAHRTTGRPVECIDNDETAAVIAVTVKARVLVILSGVEGIYADPSDPSTLVREVTAKDPESLIRKITELQKSCFGASRAGANGAGAKLEFIKEPASLGTTVIIGNPRYHLKDLIANNVPCTRIGLY